MAAPAAKPQRRLCLLPSLLLAVMALGVLSCASRPSPLLEELPGAVEPEQGLPELPPEEAGLAPPAEEPEPGLLLAFDDDYAGVWERCFDLLDRYGARVTFFVQGGYSPFCTAAASRGHEIGYHTKSHLNLLKVSREAFFEETLAGAEAFRERGLPLKSFAYPYGLSEPWMDEALGERFAVLRGFGAICRIYTIAALKSGHVSSKSIDNIQYKTDAEFEADIGAMLAALKSGGGILPLTTHTIAADADWGISPDRLEYLLKTATEMGLRFYRYGDFF